MKSRIELTKPWNQHTKEEKVLKCDKAGIPRSITLKAYHISPNSITKLKQKREGSTTDIDPMIKITRMLYDRVKPADILKKGYPPEKIKKAIDDINEIEAKYTNSDYMQTRKLFVEKGYDLDSSTPLRSGVLKLLAEKQERDEEDSSLKSKINHAAVVNYNLRVQVTALAEENFRLQSIIQQQESLELIIEKKYKNLSSQEAATLSFNLANYSHAKGAVEALSMRRR